MHEVLVNRLGGLSLPRKSVVRLTDRPDITLDVYRGRKTTIQSNRLDWSETITLPDVLLMTLHVLGSDLKVNLCTHKRPYTGRLHWYVNIPYRVSSLHN